MLKGLLSIAAVLILGSSVQARGDGNYKKCTVGDRVQDRDNRTGTVTKVQDVGTTCMVLFDGTADAKMYLFWMLRLAGKPIVDPAAVAVINVGAYACYSGRSYAGKGTGTESAYDFSKVVIRSASTYTDESGHPGRFSYDPQTQLIKFLSGPFSSIYGKYRSATEIGLSPNPITSKTFFATVCDLHR